MDTVLLLASREYLNYAAVLTVVNALPSDTIVQVTSYRTGVGHTLVSNLRTANIESVKWQPTRPTQTCSATKALLFWDGSDMTILRSLVVIRRARVPVEIYDSDGNALDLPTFCARLNHKDGNGHMASKPSVIVDAPPIAPGESQPRRDSKVRLQLHIPETVYDQYVEQARAVNLAVEKVCSDRLRTSVTHTAGRGLYFNDTERSDLERITGGHFVNTAAEALRRIETTVTLKVGDIEIELNGRVLQRASSRAKSERKTLEEYVRKEVIQGLERSVGLRPW
jgi:hypothetical protein